MSDTLRLPALTALMPSFHERSRPESDSIHEPTGPREALVGGLKAAEELLDQLETAGVTECKVVILPDASFAVRWR